MALSLAWISRSLLSTPGTSRMATRLSPCWKTLIGGNAPVPAVPPRNQSRALTMRVQTEARPLPKLPLRPAI